MHLIHLPRLLPVDDVSPAILRIPLNGEEVRIIVNVFICMNSIDVLGPMGPRTLCNACGLVYSKMIRKKD